MPTALITGASSGIGEQFAYALARQRYDLILAARREERMRQVAAEAQARGAGAVMVIPVDLAKADGARALHQQVTAAGHQIDLLVNNAGFGTHGRFHRLALEHESEEIKLDVGAVVALCGLFLPAMVAAGCGTIINVASTAGFQPVPFMATYGAGKAFLISFSLAIRQELKGTGVKVMVLCPGLTRTEFQARAHTDKKWLPEWLYMKPETVVEQGLRAMERGRAVYVNGRGNALMTQLSQLMPRRMVTAISARVFNDAEARGGRRE